MNSEQRLGIIVGRIMARILELDRVESALLHTTADKNSIEVTLMALRLERQSLFRILK